MSTRPRPRPKRITQTKGLAAGIQLSRSTLPTSEWSHPPTEKEKWSWVLNPIATAADIGDEERWKVVFGGWPVCVNRFHPKVDMSPEEPARKKRKVEPEPTNEDIIVIQDSDDSNSPIVPSPKKKDVTQAPCSKKLCKSNPFCVNYLGQEAWEDYGPSI